MTVFAAIMFLAFLSSFVKPVERLVNPIMGELCLTAVVFMLIGLLADKVTSRYQKKINDWRIRYSNRIPK